MEWFDILSGALAVALVALLMGVNFVKRLQVLVQKAQIAFQDGKLDEKEIADLLCELQKVGWIVWRLVKVFIKK